MEIHIVCLTFQNKSETHRVYIKTRPVIIIINMHCILTINYCEVRKLF